MNERLLPAVPDAEAWDRTIVEQQAYEHALQIVAARHRLATTTVTRSPRGTSAIFLSESYAVKFIPPPWKHEHAIEQAALQRVDRKLPVRTPALLGAGAIDDWTYLVTERIEGESLRDLLPILTPDDRVAIAAQAGEALSALHEVSIEDMPLLTVDWSSFARERVAACENFQRRHHLAEPAVAQLAGLIEAGSPLIPDSRRALLHADLHHEHLYLKQCNGRWTLVGILDFGDAVIGHPEYDLITPAFFVAGPNKTALRAMFAGAGFHCDEQASRRLAAWSALHRYNALARFFAADHGAQALEYMRETYWPTDEVAISV